MSHYREPFNLLHPTFCTFEVKDEEVRGTKPEEAKDRVNDFETCESEE